MTLNDLKRNDLAYIKSINLPFLKKRRLLELGLVPNTQIKIVNYTKDKELFTIFFRNYTLVLSKDIVSKIEIKNDCVSW